MEPLAAAITKTALAEEEKRLTPRANAVRRSRHNVQARREDALVLRVRDGIAVHPHDADLVQANGNLDVRVRAPVPEQFSQTVVFCQLTWLEEQVLLADLFGEVSIDLVGQEHVDAPAVGRQLGDVRLGGRVQKPSIIASRHDVAVHMSADGSAIASLRDTFQQVVPLVDFVADGCMGQLLEPAATDVTLTEQPNQVLGEVGHRHRGEKHGHAKQGRAKSHVRARQLLEP